MTRLTVGTRGSELALTQTRWVCAALRAAHPGLVIDEQIIKTHGDIAATQPMDESWPVGSFVTALEQSLLEGEIDFAVHSFKDLPTQSPTELVISAIPGREEVHDVLVLARPADLNALPAGFRIGTSSPRRSAQLLQHGDFEIVPIRGNVPTRIKKVKTENLDAVVLAAAGLRRLGIIPEHMLPLPVDRFIPSPAQGALAIQTRRDNPAREIIAVLDDPTHRRGVTAERAFLAGVEAGCQTPVGALATIAADSVDLHAQLFTDDGRHLAEGAEAGSDPSAVGLALALRLRQELEAMT